MAEIELVRDDRADTVNPWEAKVRDQADLAIDSFGWHWETVKGPGATIRRLVGPWEAVSVDGE
jgi:hypothetical protein